MRATTLKIIGSSIISLMLLYVTFRQVNWSEIAQSLRHLSWLYVVLHVAALILVQACRTYRWDLLTSPLGKVDMATSWKISGVGNMLIMLLPFRLGEFARPYLLKQATGASLTSGIAVAAVERVLDGLLVTLLFFLTTMCLPKPYEVSDVLKKGAWMALLVFLGAFAAILLMLLARNFFVTLLKKLLHPISNHLADKVIGILDAFIQGLKTLPSLWAILGVIFWTLTYWALNALAMYWLMLAFGWDLPLIAGFVVVCVLVIGIMLPAGPGFLGTYQLAILMGLNIFQVNQSNAMAYAMVSYPLTLLVLIGLGLPYFIFPKQKLHLQEMIQKENC